MVPRTNHPQHHQWVVTITVRGFPLFSLYPKSWDENQATVRWKFGGQAAQNKQPPSSQGGKGQKRAPLIDFLRTHSEESLMLYKSPRFRFANFILFQFLDLLSFHHLITQKFKEVLFLKCFRVVSRRFRVFPSKWQHSAGAKDSAESRPSAKTLSVQTIRICVGLLMHDIHATLSVRPQTKASRCFETRLLPC